MVFQEPSTALNPVFTVGWQIAEGIRAHASAGGKRVSARDAKARAIERCAKWGSRIRSTWVWWPTSLTAWW